MAYSEELIEQIWEKGIADKNWNPDVVRKDAAGAWIVKNRYADHSSIFGWDVDHIWPQKDLEEKNIDNQLINDIKNLRPMNWKNNVSKSDDYPEYRSVLRAKGKTNVEDQQYKVVNSNVQEELRRLFNIWRK